MKSLIVEIARSSVLIEDKVNAGLSVHTKNTEEIITKISCGAVKSNLRQYQNGVH